MANTQSVLSSYSEASAPGRLSSEGCEIAFFDLDRTLIDGYSLTAFVLERLSSGAASLSSLKRQLSAMAGYVVGRADYPELMRACTATLAGERADDFAHFAERVYRKRLRHRIYPQARKLVRRYQARGVHVVMVTSASRFQAAPIARSLAIREVWCTELEVVDGHLTGKAQPCFGDGKLRAARLVCERLQTPLSACAFYSDSDEDLPLLRAVGEPVVVNPKPGLARVAAAENWRRLGFSLDRAGLAGSSKRSLARRALRQGRRLADRAALGVAALRSLRP